jgi:hypothetical protein
MHNSKVIDRFMIHIGELQETVFLATVVWGIAPENRPFRLNSRCGSVVSFGLLVSRVKCPLQISFCCLRVLSKKEIPGCPTSYNRICVSIAFRSAVAECNAIALDDMLSIARLNSFKLR